jgi:hypothetical protein
MALELKLSVTQISDSDERVVVVCLCERLPAFPVPYNVIPVGLSAETIVQLQEYLP